MAVLESRMAYTPRDKRILRAAEHCPEADKQHLREALTKQNAEKPDHTLKSGIYETYEYYYCPRCGCELEREGEPDYCSECGQHIKWE